MQLSWGQIMHHAFQRGGFTNGMWTWYVPPVLCIALCTLGFFCLGLYVEQRAQNLSSLRQWMTDLV